MGARLKKVIDAEKAQKEQAKKKLRQYADLETRREIRAACAEWKYTEPGYRDPDTLKGLARALQVSLPTVRRYISSLPSTMDEYLDMVKKNLLARSLGTMTRMSDGRTAHAVSAGKTVLEQVLLPELSRKDVQKPSTPSHIQKAFENVAGNKNRQQTENQSIESKPVN